MTSRLLLLVTTFGVVVTSCRGDAVDATRTPGTTGSDVVNSVVDVIKAKYVFFLYTVFCFNVYLFGQLLYSLSVLCFSAIGFCVSLFYFTEIS